jgi:hypothetical protein
MPLTAEEAELAAKYIYGFQDQWHAKFWIAPCKQKTLVRTRGYGANATPYTYQKWCGSARTARAALSLVQTVPLAKELNYCSPQVAVALERGVLTIEALDAAYVDVVRVYAGPAYDSYPHPVRWAAAYQEALSHDRHLVAQRLLAYAKGQRLIDAANKPCLDYDPLED